jgi:hypothetical protein
MCVKYIFVYLNHFQFKKFNVRICNTELKTLNWKLKPKLQDKMFQGAQENIC